MQGKFILLSTLGILALAGVLGSLAATKNKDILYGATEKQGRVLAQTVAALIINELIYEKLGLVEEGGLIDNYVQELFRRRDMDFLYIAVLDETGKVLSHNDFREYGKVYGDVPGDFPGGMDSVTVRKGSESGGTAETMEFVAPLSIGGKLWGYLLFEVSLERVARETRTMLLQIMTVAFVALLFSFVLVYFLSRRFIGPITDMAAAMQEVDLEMPEKTIRVSGDDELARLGESFNEMVLRIRQANEDMRRTHEKLLQSEKLATLGLLSSSVAHRINNPLGGLFNCVSMLEQKGGNAEFRAAYLELMKEGLESIRQTVGQLLWTAGRKKTDEKEANVSQVLAGVLRFLEYRMRNAGIRYEEDVPPDLMLPVPPQDLNEICQNVMFNAVQAMPDGGTLKVAATAGEHGAALRFSDTGVGIPPEDLERIFDLFYSTKEPGEGTGLGLWMTYELVKKHKGNIRVESSGQGGTTITIDFADTP
ncbi:MAG: ATP-binding protein [Desulfobulbaceae bacterium]